MLKKILSLALLFCASSLVAKESVVVTITMTEGQNPEAWEMVKKFADSTREEATSSDEQLLMKMGEQVTAILNSKDVETATKIEASWWNTETPEVQSMTSLETKAMETEETPMIEAEETECSSCGSEL